MERLAGRSFPNGIHCKELSDRESSPRRFEGGRCYPCLSAGTVLQRSAKRDYLSRRPALSRTAPLVFERHGERWGPSQNQQVNPEDSAEMRCNGPRASVPVPSPDESHWRIERTPSYEKRYEPKRCCQG